MPGPAFLKIIRWPSLPFGGCLTLNCYGDTTIIDHGMASTLLICAILLVIIQAGIIFLISSRNKMADTPEPPLHQPAQLAKTKQQLYREIARHEATEELLRETQEYMQCIVNSMPFMLAGVTPDGYVTHWNNAAEKHTGLPAEQALGAHINQVYSALPVDLDTIASIIESGQPFRRENVQSGHGSDATFSDITIYPLVAPDIAGAVILSVDVTRRVRLENMMIQNEKMLSLGELAAGLAHEINNPLAGVLNNVQNIIRRISPGLPANYQTAENLNVNVELIHTYLDQRGVFGFIEKIQEAGERAAQIVTNMLEFSRNNNQTHSPTNMAELIEHSLQLAKNNFELDTLEGVEIPKLVLKIDEDLPKVPCNSSEIQQVLLNLFSNAAQSFQSNEYGAPLEPEIACHLFCTKKHLIVEVSDNGPGMTSDVRKHIFEPFYTTKDVGKGTGLGLSVSYFIVTEHHKGSIEVESEPGRGTLFRIMLPLKPSLRALQTPYPKQSGSFD